MIPDYYVCDICEYKIPKEVRFHITVDRAMGPAGDSENESYPIDLCHMCMRHFLMDRVDASFEKAKEFRKEVDIAKKQHLVKKQAGRAKTYKYT